MVAVVEGDQETVGSAQLPAALLAPACDRAEDGPRAFDDAPAVAEDAATLIRCIKAAYAEYKDRVADLPAVAEGVPDDITANRVWVAEVDGNVVGGLVLIKKDGFAILANVAVDPRNAGRGLGRALIEHAEAMCREAGLSDLRLATHVGMPENIRLYRRLGWRESGRSGNKVHMTKRL